MRESRGNRIIARSMQCTTCQFEGEILVKERIYGYCTMKKKRFIDLSIWENCQDYKVKKEVRGEENAATIQAGMG